MSLLFCLCLLAFDFFSFQSSSRAFSPLQDLLLIEDLHGEVTELLVPDVSADEQVLWMQDLQEGADRARRLQEQKRRRKATLAESKRSESVESEMQSVETEEGNN